MVANKLQQHYCDQIKHLLSCSWSKPLLLTRSITSYPYTRVAVSMFSNLSALYLLFAWSIFFQVLSRHLIDAYCSQECFRQCLVIFCIGYNWIMNLLAEYAKWTTCEMVKWTGPFCHFFVVHFTLTVNFFRFRTSKWLLDKAETNGICRQLSM